ncbi:UDP-N-acetylmuramoyl-tripeptide--D-alanyl-D-alanine ligase [Caproiciproducens sp. NJN-50]|uniref:UDP-N-acetylmuramoyl-tripeptide--D-alanyl-D- alanine ligase n=1 Tax=Acutalibacteraceae TaxID=3082771 RepID=UPI000FFE0CB7|nr:MULTISPECIES: UDP-N-acetylmuramoyl-tripeptide--D-alanyl-D-alanine ligase [Acutalibacteraceae]QAT49530.1 UDP-N-acetylmuramoyl-tripeptide--D-alanyl-D-alanine ligase [Caproiciproducens sp. NJN-50]
MKMTVSEIVSACGGRLLCGDPGTEVTSVSTDSRNIAPGALFVPIRGERVNAHEFIPAVLRAGAAAVLTQEHQAARGPGAWIAAGDTRDALQRIAAEYRKRFSLPVVGITGSVGKTSTKEMVALALSAKMDVMKTSGNNNSQVGVPLTIFRLSETYDAAVVEMGMSEFGEMSRIAQVAAPDYAVMTNIGVSHIQQLGSRQNILAEKLHITDCFHQGSVLFLNGDDAMLHELAGTLPFETVLFGTGTDCAFRAERVESAGESTRFFYLAPNGERGEAVIPIIGAHHVLNALAGLAVAQRLGVPLSAAAAALSGYQAPAMRQQIRRTGNGVTVIDDSYNSSPDAAKSSLGVLKSFRGGKRVAVLADMLELGNYSSEAHADVGAFAANSEVDLLITVGTRAGAMAGGARSVRPDMDCRVCENNRQACEILKSLLKPGDAVLVKGSRSMHTEEIVSFLLY